MVKTATAKQLMDSVVIRMEHHGWRAAKAGGGNRSLTPPLWNRDDMFNMFLEESRNLDIRRRWSAPSVKTIIPEFYGRIIMVETRCKGKHYYTTATFYQTAVEILIERNSELEELRRALRKATESLELKNKEIYNLKSLYQLRGIAGKNRIAMIRKLLTEISEVVDCEHDVTLKRENPSWFK